MTAAAHGIPSCPSTLRTPPSSSTSTTSRWASAPISERSFGACCRRRSSREGRGAARLRRLATLPAVHRPALRGVDRPDLRAGVRVVEEERDRHPPRDRRTRARLHAPRDRHVHPALGRLRFLEPRHQAQGVRQVRHRRRHSRVVERSARAELRRVLQLQRARRSGESSPRTSRRASTIRGSSSPKPFSA